jgi:hypothetical protein
VYCPGSGRALQCKYLINLTSNFYIYHINLLNAKLNPNCHLLALLGCATIVVVSRLSIKWVPATAKEVAGMKKKGGGNTNNRGKFTECDTAASKWGRQMRTSHFNIEHVTNHYYLHGTWTDSIAAVSTSCEQGTLVSGFKKGGKFIHLFVTVSF